MPRANYKLSFCYFGPFQILKKIGAVAYRLQLPPSSSIHPVFHVPQIKRAVDIDTHVSTSLPRTYTQLQVRQQILQCRTVRHNNHTVPHVLVQWSSWLAFLSTLENETTLRQHFPAAPAWGQAGSVGRGNVMIKSVQDSEPNKGTSAGRGVRNCKPNKKFFAPDWRPK